MEKGLRRRGEAIFHIVSPG